METNTEIQRAYRRALVAAVISACLAGIFLSLSFVRWDFGGYKKVAYEEGIKKGLADGRELGLREPGFAEAGKVYISLYCERDYSSLVTTVCLVRPKGKASAQFIKLPGGEHFIKPYRIFKVSYNPANIYFVE